MGGSIATVIAALTFPEFLNKNAVGTATNIKAG